MKGVILAAGYGTRFLPITKTIPKEMLPLGTRPTIDYVVQEFLDSGIRDILLITSRRKKVLEDYFDREPELEEVFRRERKRAQLERIAPLEALLYFVRQRQMSGTGDAVLLVRDFAGQEPFVVAFPDDILISGPPLAQQLIEVHQRTGGSVIALEERPPGEDISRYGVAAIEGPLPAPRVTSVVEKPPRGEEPSRLISVGRYLLAPAVFSILEEERRAHPGGEFFLTGALDHLARAGQVTGCVYRGERLDTGEPQGYYQALVRFILNDPEQGPAFREFLRTLVR
ncbi:MAG: UTP--glucose-1-phosphate uridylyltransferase [Armatimonadetes bacterium]|nr:UTP--glucose-1-phosphate uridylyltransferase [Armatimonadota bacterium]